MTNTKETINKERDLWGGRYEIVNAFRAVVIPKLMEKYTDGIPMEVNEKFEKKELYVIEDENKQEIMLLAYELANLLKEEGNNYRPRGMMSASYILHLLGVTSKSWNPYEHNIDPVLFYGPAKCPKKHFPIVFEAGPMSEKIWDKLKKIMLEKYKVNIYVVEDQKFYHMKRIFVLPYSKNDLNEYVPSTLLDEKGGLSKDSDIETICKNHHLDYLSISYNVEYIEFLDLMQKKTGNNEEVVKKLMKKDENVKKIISFMSDPNGFRNELEKSEELFYFSPITFENEFAYGEETKLNSIEDMIRMQSIRNSIVKLDFGEYQDNAIDITCREYVYNNLRKYYSEMDSYYILEDLIMGRGFDHELPKVITDDGVKNNQFSIYKKVRYLTSYTLHYYEAIYQMLLIYYYLNHRVLFDESAREIMYRDEQIEKNV